MYRKKVRESGEGPNEGGLDGDATRKRSVEAGKRKRRSGKISERKTGQRGGKKCTYNHVSHDDRGGIRRERDVIEMDAATRLQMRFRD